MTKLSQHFALFLDEFHHKKEDIIHDAFAEIIQKARNNREISIGNIVTEADAYQTLTADHMKSEDKSLFKPALAHFFDAD